MNCTNPVMIRNPNRPSEFMEVPCGKCMACRITKTREWSTRLLHEMYYWKDSCFTTLTYSDDHIPRTPCGRCYLKKSDLQNFIKRLRFELSKQSRTCKFFACGEYGDITKRCHFHLILFGVSPKELSLLERVWSKGFVKVGSVTPDSIQYVTGYVRKKLNGDLQQKQFGCPICYGVPEFQLQSQGLGKDFAQSEALNIINSGITVRGKKQSIPRYYGKKVDLIQTKFLEKSAQNEIKQRFEHYLESREDELGQILRERSIARFSSDRQKDLTLRAKNNLYKGKL